MEKHLVMYLTRKSIMLLRKYLLVTEFQVSKCGSHIVKIRMDVLYPKRTKFSKYRKGRCSRGCKPDGTQLGFGRYGTHASPAYATYLRAHSDARKQPFRRAQKDPFDARIPSHVRVFSGARKTVSMH